MFLEISINTPIKVKSLMRCCYLNLRVTHIGTTPQLCYLFIIHVSSLILHLEFPYLFIDFINVVWYVVRTWNIVIVLKVKRNIKWSTQSTPVDTYTSQLLHLWPKEHHRRRARKTVRPIIVESETVFPCNYIKLTVIVVTSADMLRWKEEVPTGSHI